VFLVVANFRVRGARVTDCRVSFSDTLISLEGGAAKSQRELLAAVRTLQRAQALGGSSLTFTFIKQPHSGAAFYDEGLALCLPGERQQQQQQQPCVLRVPAAAAARAAQQQPLAALTYDSSQGQLGAPEAPALFYCCHPDILEQLPPQHVQLLQQTPVECLVSSVYFKFAAKYGGPPPFDADLCPLLRPPWLGALKALKAKPGGPRGAPLSSSKGGPHSSSKEEAGAPKRRTFVCIVDGEEDPDASVNRCC
ncbi:hypothetical protein, conserved, partial [Eimeria tenella]